MGRRSRAASGKPNRGKKKRGGGDAGDAEFSGALHDSDQPTPDDEGFLRVDPRRIRFQYSRIRPTFSGCGRSVESTLESIRRGELRPDDLPPILVLIGPTVASETADGGGGAAARGGRWYFSLNNRRLWVLKRFREEGLLERQGNTVRVRVREWKSDRERERYTVKKCALEAKFMREPKARGERDDGGAEAEREERGVVVTASGEKDAGEKDDEEKYLLLASSGGVRSSVGDDRQDDDESDASSDGHEQDEGGTGGVAMAVNRFALCGFDSDSETDEV